jgi:hypothetical protein
MAKKMYAALVISTTPIDLGNLRNQEGVEHYINESFDVEANSGACRGGWELAKLIPDRCLNKPEPIRSTASTIAGVITAWLHEVCESSRYIPLREIKRMEALVKEGLSEEKDGQKSEK